MIKKIFIPNRGEIAVRIIRACKEMGVTSVAAYSDADRDAMHVYLADEAVKLGPAPATESYLNMEKIIEVAKKVGADAIHPGYGFLAENHRFVTLCEENNIIFIGPKSDALKLVGDKIASRVTIQKTDVPIIPGMTMAKSDLEIVKKEAERIGYPIIVKASLGGGGKGMQVVREADKLEEAIESSRRIAKSAFGDETVYLERYIENPRHVEIQVLADEHGNAIHLFERECSIQRRHQKIIEESPSTAIDENIRRQMGEAAVKVVRETNYTNAGTVEFLLDKDKNFYFLEVNARVQVEHPVTELVTGVDIVKQQIKIASGEPLTIKQEDVIHRGHAIEARIYAEDPENNFLPSPGKINFLQEPAGPGIRLDSGVYEGSKVSSFYDPIVAKLIVYDEDRDKAIEKLTEALSSYVIGGIKTIIPFLLGVLNHEEFRKGNLSTSFIDDYNEDILNYESSVELLFPAIAAYGLFSQNDFGKGSFTEKKAGLPKVWDTLGNWRITK